MSARSMFIRMLLRAYPSAWRREYGAELEDILLSRGIGPLVVGDVIVGGLTQRIRSTDISTWFGLGAFVAVVADLIWNVTSAQTADHGLLAVVARSSKTLPTVVVVPLMSESYAQFLTLYGMFMQFNRRRSLSECGRATEKSRSWRACRSS